MSSTPSGVRTVPALPDRAAHAAFRRLDPVGVVPTSGRPTIERIESLSPAARDVPLDLVRGLAMVILVVNHIHLESALEYVTRTVLSAAEVLVSISGVVVGMVFGRRWLTQGARVTTVFLLRRSRKLYLASVAVVVLVGALARVPGLATDALTVSPTMQPQRDLYAFDGGLRTLWAIVTLEAGPWQFSILGFFIAALAVAPGVLWALDRGWWPAVLLASWALFGVGRTWQVDVLPAQSERQFPLLVWQVLFVNGMLLGWYRDRVAAWVNARRGLCSAAIVTVALTAAYVRLHGPGLDLLRLDALLGYGSPDWSRWEDEHFDKASLDLARVVTMVSITAATYLALRRCGSLAQRSVGWLLLPLGRNSFYVFIMHVFVCLAVASAAATAGDRNGLGLVGNAAVQIGCLALLSTMVRRRFLFRWVPR